ncbi:MAG: hypothetical protein AUI14_17715 [Actinobacteria bacterium 13_2_20CM_2_71_6]|nr:MAG: hypothetical protein AUI14_17715 [Actinobacteria bacterium 13_2_20CM_2_71_6]
MMPTTLDEVRAEALFAGDLQPSQHPAPEQVRRAVAGVLHRRGSRWCAARMAEEFGEHPEAAALRMTWALRVIRDCYAKAAPVPPTRCRATGGPAGSRSTAGNWRNAGPFSGRLGTSEAALMHGEAPRCPYPVGRYRRSVS